MCSKTQRIDSASGRQRLAKTSTEHGLVLVDGIPESCIKARTKINVRCIKCNATVESKVMSILAGKISCLCSSQLSWSNDLQKTRLLEAIAKSRFNLASDLPASLGCNTQIDVVCKECGGHASPTVNNMVRPRSVGCLCANSSEEEVYAVVSALATSHNVKAIHQHIPGDVIGIGGRPLRFDIVVTDIKGSSILFVEVDGPHHFDPSFVYSASTAPSKGAFEHDLRKESYVYKGGRSMLRLSVFAVRNSGDWKHWIRRRMSEAIAGTLPPMVYTLGSKLEYRTGEYARLRGFELKGN
jgi:hypothetical protein